MIQAVLYDMDGLIIDSEPLWQLAEIEVFATVGIQLTPDLCRQTMGKRVDEVVRYWHGRQPWPAPPDLPTLTETIVQRVEELVRTVGKPMPGLHHSLALCQQNGLRCAVASSSFMRLIKAVVSHLGLTPHFEVLHSAEYEAQGKPHPAVFLTAARLLGVAPENCVVLEDSPNGVRAALAAGMRCIAVPDHALIGHPVFAEAHATVPSLQHLTPALLLGQ